MWKFRQKWGPALRDSVTSVQHNSVLVGRDPRAPKDVRVGSRAERSFARDVALGPDLPRGAGFRQDAGEAALQSGVLSCGCVEDRPAGRSPGKDLQTKPLLPNLGI